MEKHCENRPKIDPRRRPGAPKINSKSLPGPSQETSCRARASRRRLGSVSGASQSVPGRSPGGPGESPRATRHARKFALERLGARRGDQNRRQVASEKGKIELSACSAFAKHRRSDFSSIFVNFRFFGEVCEPLKVLRLLAKTKVRPFALRVESLARCHLEKPPKSEPKSTQNQTNRSQGVLQKSEKNNEDEQKRLSL